tara:strand:- start:23894 stop:24160 length:267 start_codon:yes stop_codon:yes gene_type:complete
VQSKDSIYNHLATVLVQLFEIDSDAVRPDARLEEDLDIDSIDAIDIAVEMQALTERKIQPEEFKDISTVQDIVDAVYNLATTEGDTAA